MYCTVKEIIRDVLDTDVPDSECVFAVVLTRGDVRHIAQDWSLTDDELETVMQRLDDAFVYGACDRVVSDIVNELMEEKRASRHVTVPAVMLGTVWRLHGMAVGAVLQPDHYESAVQSRAGYPAYPAGFFPVASGGRSGCRLSQRATPAGEAVTVF